MAKRKFELPGINNLSKEQELARSLPKGGQHLIVGGPGTGKSVVALLRCLRHARDNEDYIFLVYNHLLNRASGQLFGKELISQQWQSWLMSTFFKMTCKKLPRKPADKFGYEDIDWDGALDVIKSLEEVKNEDFPYLIIDEGQDMPPQFYQALVELGFENFYVVADQNQQIEPEKNSLIKEIQNILALEIDTVVELKSNYRNTFPIARLAREFYTDPKSPPPELPPSTGKEIKPVLAEYAGPGGRTFNTIITAILKEIDRDPRRLIGVITPNNKVREFYFKELGSTKVTLDNGKARVVTYCNGAKHDLYFDEGGIMVINAKSCKGLEFDTVYLADINKFPFWPAIEAEKRKLFYVMIARAVDRIIMLKNAKGYCPIDKIIPKDPNVLEQRK